MIMKRRILPLLTLQLAVTALVGITVPVSAHHSFAMFDKSHVVTVKGALNKLEWSNPHVYLFVTVAGADGVSKEYIVEAGSINILSRKGWKINTVKLGDTLSVSFYPLKDGHPGGLLDSVTLPDGTVKKG
jgi:hypothetical protein